MQIAIHQPNFAPWLGFFSKMAQADVFVLLDDVQFIKRSFIHRNYIKTARGKEWFGPPVLTKGRYFQQIAETEINEAEPWRERLLATLQHQYGRAPFYKHFIGDMRSILEESGTRLIDLNVALIDFARSVLELDCRVVKSSQLSGVTGASTERLVSICRCVGATAYLSGMGGRNYMDEELFRAEGISLAYNEFENLRYPQLHGEFIEGLSVLDVFFNAGPEARDLLRRTRGAVAVADA